MKILFASDSFKGSLSSEKIIQILRASANRIFPGCETIGIPVADGGEGTIDAVISITGGHRRVLTAHGPLMEEVECSYGVFNEDNAIIEMAAVSGLPLVPAGKRDPRYTSSYGTGELIKDALDQGYRNITIAIGGSATNDGGMGAMAALGIRFLDEDGCALDGVGANLKKISEIDVSGIHPAVAETEFTVMCDVKNPLTGTNGATYTFGVQKGGTPKILDELEAGMEQYAKLLHNKTGINVNQLTGAGAAGGLGAALFVFLHARMEPGIETVLNMIHFDELLNEVDVVITGEGRLDWQSAFGKVPSGIAMRCRTRGIPVVAIVGEMGSGAGNIYEFGVESIIPTINSTMDLEEALDRAEELYEEAADRTFRLLRIGMNIVD